MALQRQTARRALLAGVILALLAPTVVSAATYAPPTAADRAAAGENVTFVSTQGGFGPTGADGRVLAIDTDTKEVVWERSIEVVNGQRDIGYYDIDPLSTDRVLFVRKVANDAAYAVEMNWRTGEVYREFETPLDTHDVDKLGPDRYVVADKFNHRAYVYDAANDSIVWEYEFENHFAPYPEAGEGDETERSGVGGYTHLNDVDVVDDDTFLLSPRNFDRVVAVNRTTKETEWVLGEEDAHDILHEQHNPALISRDPRAVLVADSENNRVVEYHQRPDGTWNRTWTYRGGLRWPRDADRLPNGNTLVVDTFGQRVLEVNASGEVVWERETRLMPYDVERLNHGEEPMGPPIQNGAVIERTEAGSTGLLEEGYTTAAWVLPPWVGLLEFYTLVGAALVALGWAVWGGLVRLGWVGGGRTA